MSTKQCPRCKKFVSDGVHTCVRTNNLYSSTTFDNDDNFTDGLIAGMAISAIEESLISPVYDSSPSYDNSSSYDTSSSCDTSSSDSSFCGGD